MPALPAGCVLREVRRWHDGVVTLEQDRVAEELPVALVYNDVPHVVMMATPRDLEELALGFSLSEAVISRADELQSVESNVVLEGIELRLRIPAVRADELAARRRNLTGRSGCGLCGVESLEDALRQPAPLRGGPRIDAATLHLALQKLGACQPLNLATGATHAAAWVLADGSITLLREDVGRHNALDKLVGALAQSRTDLLAGFLIVTSRASSEMVQKAATAGITVLAAISAPTALAIQLAASSGLSLVGFARAGSHVVYTHPRRILEHGGASA
jgi:FdhD protein